MEWKPFRNSFDKSDRKKFLMRCCLTSLSSICRRSYAVLPIRLYPILMSILLYCYEQLSGCISEVEQMMVKAEEGLAKEE